MTRFRRYVDSNGLGKNENVHTLNLSIKGQLLLKGLGFM